MAKWICRTADRVDPARVYRSSDRAQRRAPKADPCEILRLLQWVASSCFARKGCAGRAPDQPLRGHRRTCNLGRIASPLRANLVFGSDSRPTKRDQTTGTTSLIGHAYNMALRYGVSMAVKTVRFQTVRLPTGAFRACAAKY